MPERKVDEDDADFINNVVSKIGYAMDAKSAIGKTKSVVKATRAALAARAASAAAAAARAASTTAPTIVRVALRKAPMAVKRLPVAGAILDTALLSNKDTRESVFREVEDDAQNAGPVKRIVKGALSPIATSAGIANMVSDTNEMADTELLEAAEPDLRYVAKKKRAKIKETFPDAVERRLAQQGNK